MELEDGGLAPKKGNAMQFWTRQVLPAFASTLAAVSDSPEVRKVVQL
jgi:hypothetical protein